MHAVTAQQMKEMDRLTIESFGIPGIVLMENAGRGCVDSVLRHFPALSGTKVGIAAGHGNNGGDGFVIARYLAGRDVDVSIFLLSNRNRVRGDAAANLELVDRLGLPVFEVPDIKTFESHRSRMRQCGLWIDALLGTGLKSNVRGPFKPCIEWLNDRQVPIISVDIPSGLDSDTGKPCGCCVKAAMTVTFGFPKIGQLVFPGVEFTGSLKVVDIGIPHTVVDLVDPPYRLLTEHGVKQRFKPRRLECHKGNTGHLLVIGGSPGKTGASAMTGLAAMRVGAGLVTLGIPKSLNRVMESLLMEVMTAVLPESADHTLGLSSFDKIMGLLEAKRALAIGPGLGTGKSTKNLVIKLIESSPVPVVIDADALNALAGDTRILKSLKVPVVMTPHPGEMARLTGKTPAKVQDNRLDEARRFAEANRVHLVLKGARTIVAHPDGTALINPTGNPGMASGGMGDILTGMIAGFVVQGMGAGEAAEAAVYLHGLAADSLARCKGPVGFLASEVAEKLPMQIKALLTPADDQGRRGHSLITAL